MVGRMLSCVESNYFCSFSEEEKMKMVGDNEAGVGCALLCGGLDSYCWACGPCSLWALTCSEATAVSSSSSSELSELESPS